jgi:hypothetical protein
VGLYSQKISWAAPIELATSLRFHELAWRGDALQRNSMAETVCAEIIYYRERAGLAREKANAAIVPEAKKNHLAEEARWLALVRSHQLQDKLSRTLGASPPNKMKSPCYDFEPEVIAMLSSPNSQAAMTWLG